MGNKGKGRRRRRARRIFDEHDPAGGAVKSWLFLVHPGPSSAVTLVAVAAAGLMRAGMARIGLAAVVMLCGQCAIGVLNDVCDVRADRDAQRYKPLVRSPISRGGAAVLGLALAGCSLVAATQMSPALVLATSGGLAAGIAYDLGLKRTILSWVPWWGGLLAFLLFTAAVADRFDRMSPWIAVVTVPLAIGLQCANALPDIAGDQRNGVRSLPVRLGPGRSRMVAAAGTLVALGAVPPLWRATAAHPGRLSLGLYVAGGTLLALAALGRRVPRPGAAAMVGSGLVALSWLAAPGG